MNYYGVETGDYESTRDRQGRFGAGNPGRPPGARNRIASRAAQRVLHFFESRSAEMLEDLYANDRKLFLKVLAMAMPNARHLDLDDYDALGLDDPRLPGDALMNVRQELMEAKLRSFSLETQLRDAQKALEAAKAEMEQARSEQQASQSAVEPLAAAVDLGLRRKTVNRKYGPDTGDLRSSASATPLIAVSAEAQRSRDRRASA